MMEISKNPFVKPHSRRTFIKGAVVTACGMVAPRVSASKFGPRTESSARFYEAEKDGSVTCRLCFRGCTLDPDEFGHCGIRVNRRGKLMTMSYGNPGAINVDPIEKKPFFHYLPGTTAFSLAAVGCNIDCKFCQNWQIAHARPGDLRTFDLPPEKIALEAKKYGCRTIAYTYSEPTVWSEYVYDCASASLFQGVGSVIVSNGSWQPAVLKELLTVVKSIKIDFKSIEPAYYRNVCDAELEPILKNILMVHKSDVWLELVNLVVTTLNDKDANFKKLARWVFQNLGPDVPVHFTRFHPMYKLKNLAPTPVATLDRAYDIARAEGLHYVYIGNVPGHRGQNTYCPKCNKLLIQRNGFLVEKNLLNDGKCPACGAVIPGRWK